MEIEAPLSSFEVLKHNKFRNNKLFPALKPLFQPSKLARQPSFKKLLGNINHQQAYNMNTEESQPSTSSESKDFSIKRRSPSVEHTLKMALSYKPEGVKKLDLKRKSISRTRNSNDVQSISVASFKNQENGYHWDVSRRIETTTDANNDSDLGVSFERVRPRAGTLRPIVRSNPRDVSFILDRTIQQAEQSPPKSSNDKIKVPTPPLPSRKKSLTPFDLVFGPNVANHILKRHAIDVIEGVKYALERVNSPTLTQILPKQISLKKFEFGFRRTLVLDLDETLITTKPTNDQEEVLPSIKGGQNPHFRLRIRPYAEEFLREMSKEFEIVIFTAAEQRYAEHIVRVLDPHRQYVSHILHRDNCLKTRKGLFIKDLRLIKNRELKDMVIVDNFVHSFSFQIENGIPIITWEGDQNDQELKYLMNYLREAKTYTDMRQFNRERLRLSELVDVAVEKFVNL